MLFLLTGDIQIGKTRWLAKVVDELEARGVVPVGVIAPGTWIEHHDEGGGVSYEKTGIDNELLPSHERIPFARRHDLALEEGTLDSSSQASRAQLGWAIDDNAIERVNEHFEELLSNDFAIPTPSDAAETAQKPLGETADSSNRAAQDSAFGQQFLVVDELGRLELLRGEGLTAATAAIDHGATARCPHALVIVREQLLAIAQERFANAPWNGMQAISPNNEAARLLLDSYR